MVADFCHAEPAPLRPWKRPRNQSLERRKLGFAPTYYTTPFPMSRPYSSLNRHFTVQMVMSLNSTMCAQLNTIQSSVFETARGVPLFAARPSLLLVPYVLSAPICSLFSRWLKEGAGRRKDALGRGTGENEPSMDPVKEKDRG
jgi:hypothetical protein